MREHRTTGFRFTRKQTAQCVLIAVAPLMGFALSGCVEDTPQPAPVVATSAPPPPPQTGVVYAPVAPPPNQAEVRGTQPRPDAIWIGGHYVWQTQGWVWTGGHWDLPPYPGAKWVTGYYRKNQYGYRWVEGSWQ